MIVTNKITVDLAVRGITERIHAMQGDDHTRAVEITLLENGNAWNVPDGTAVSVAFTNEKQGNSGWYDTMPSGENAGTAAGNVITAKLAPALLSAPGQVAVAVILKDPYTLAQLAVFQFAVVVEKNPAYGGEIRNDYYNYNPVASIVDGVLVVRGGGEEGI